MSVGFGCTGVATLSLKRPVSLITWTVAPVFMSTCSYCVNVHRCTTCLPLNYGTVSCMLLSTLQLGSPLLLSLLLILAYCISGWCQVSHCGNIWRSGFLQIGILLPISCLFCDSTSLTCGHLHVGWSAGVRVCDLSWPIEKSDQLNGLQWLKEEIEHHLWTLYAMIELWYPLSIAKFTFCHICSIVITTFLHALVQTVMLAPSPITKQCIFLYSVCI